MVRRQLVLGVLLGFMGWTAVAAPEAQGDAVTLHFYWSKSCPHCQQARAFLPELLATRPWVILDSRELSESAENRRAYLEMTEQLGEEPRGVPAFAFCDQLMIGFDDAQGMGAWLGAALDRCGGVAVAGEVATGDQPVRLPGLGALDSGQWSLPLLTLLIAGVDAFNPCAFFVLLFLLSLLVHARSRLRMALVGSVFVAFSGIWYFAFMAAWLNVFAWFGELRLLTLVAGLLAITVATLNIKDYFYFKVGPSLTIPEEAKPGLFARMRKLMGAEKIPALLVGTVVLAAAANSYELLCTAGFPMVYTRILTLAELSTPAYYGYLALYNLIYIIPLAVIVAVFTATLGARKLGEREGRILKLTAGLLMLGLGLALVFEPSWLNQLGFSVVLIALTTLVTILVVRLRPLAHP
ncbi:MAG: glutaredoxin family protein [Candidatus Competibacterales bacterium]